MTEPQEQAWFRLGSFVHSLTPTKTLTQEQATELHDLVEATRQAATIDVTGLAAAIAAEVHVDEAHGFPPGFGPSDLAAAIFARLTKETA